MGRPRICTLAFRTKHSIPKPLRTIGEARKWISTRLQFPVEEACLIKDGRACCDEEEIGEDDLWLVTLPAGAEGVPDDCPVRHNGQKRDGEGDEEAYRQMVQTAGARKKTEKVTLYVEDTTRRKRLSKKTGKLMSKMYAVRVLPHQTLKEVRTKLAQRSSCKIPHSEMRFVVRGRQVVDHFSIREYLITQRTQKLVFFLSRVPVGLMMDS